MSASIHVVGMAGSLRAGSFNKSALRAAAQLLPDGMTLEIVSINEIPLYNGDIEAEGLPESVLKLISALSSADALLIATPEYNASIPGVLKNTLDWISRAPNPSPVNGKPLAILGASPGMLGTVRSQYHLRQVAVSLNMHVLNRPEVFIGAAHTKVNEAGELTDEGSKKVIAAQMIALRDWALQLKGETKGENR